MYPLTYEADIASEGRNRLSTFFRYIYAIPAMIVAMLYGIGALFAVIIAWFSIVFTGEYPTGLYDFIGKALRVGSRTNSYLLLATDEYPPLNGDDDPGYPVRIGIPEPLGAYDRIKTGLRLLVGIPVFLLNYVQQIIGSVISFIAWFTIVFTGKVPEGLIKPLHSALAYQTKASAYVLLMTEDYPPFTDEGPGPVAGHIGSGAKTEA